MPRLLFFAGSLLLALLTCAAAPAQSLAQPVTRTWYTATGRRTAFPDSAACYTITRKQGAGGTITTYQRQGRRLHQERYSQLRAGQRHGLSTVWDAATGRRVASYPYSRGRLHGVVQTWYATGRPQWQLAYRQGQRHGTLRAWYPGGRPLRTETYRAGVRTAARCYTQAGQDTAWFAFERPARFADGPQALQSWLISHLRYPALALRNQVEGIAGVRFVVDARGRISNIEMVKPLGAGTEEEIRRLLGTMPAWEPAVAAGRAVAVPYELPVEFRIR